MGVISSICLLGIVEVELFHDAFVDALEHQGISHDPACLDAVQLQQPHLAHFDFKDHLAAHGTGVRAQEAPGMLVVHGFVMDGLQGGQDVAQTRKNSFRSQVGGGVVEGKGKAVGTDGCISRNQDGSRADWSLGQCIFRWR